MTGNEKKPRGGGAGFVLLHPTDNILVCTRSTRAGDSVEIDGHAYRLAGEVQLGHKIARRDLGAGDKVFRYGLPIGSMKVPVSAAGHVHSHNLASDYIPAHGRDAHARDGS